MAFKHTFQFKSDEGCIFRYTVFISIITDFQQPHYSIYVKSEIQTRKYDGLPIYHVTGLSETVFAPLIDLKQALEFFRIKVYQKFAEESKQRSIYKKLEKFGFDLTELELDIHSNFLTDNDINNILKEVNDG